MIQTDRGDQIARATPGTGAVAPEIVLPAAPARTWALRDSRGKAVVLVFYPADWEPVSTDQLQHYNEIVPQILDLNAELVGISSWDSRCSRMLTPAVVRRERTACTGPGRAQASARWS